MATNFECRSIYSKAAEPTTCASEIVAGLRATEAAAVMFFASPAQDGSGIARALRDAFPDAPTIGCTTAGEFNEREMGDGGVSAVAIPRGIVRRAISAMGDFRDGCDEGVRQAIRSLSAQWNVTLRDLDPSKYVGFVLIEGMHGYDERVNELLGDEAPLLNFVGGTAGDDLKFQSTAVFRDSQSTNNGVALMLLELEVPFAVLKTCSYERLGKRLTITRVDKVARIVWEIDGRPAAEVYADALGITVDKLDPNEFATYPVALVMNDDPWIRCVQQVLDGGGLSFACRLLEGMEVEVMRSTDIIAATKIAVQNTVARLGGKTAGAVLFNCAWRKIELEKKKLDKEYLHIFEELPSAGFHTYGESWLGHMNCTLTGVVFGAKG